jgi:hypothetical protein
MLVVAVVEFIRLVLLAAPQVIFQVRLEHQQEEETEALMLPQPL